MLDFELKSKVTHSVARRPFILLPRQKVVIFCIISNLSRKGGTPPPRAGTQKKRIKKNTKFLLQGVVEGCIQPCKSKLGFFVLFERTFQGHSKGTVVILFIY